MQWRKLHHDCTLPVDGLNYGPESARYAYTAVWAPSIRSVVLHGGSNINAYNHRVGVLAHTYHYVFGDTLASTGMSLKFPADVNAYHAPPRSEHTAVMYSKGSVDTMVVYGGRGNTLDWVRGDTLHYDVRKYTWEKSTTFRNCSGHSAVLHDGRMYVVGGWDGYSFFYPDLAVYDVEARTWSTPTVAGGPPEPRRHASFALVVPPGAPEHAYALLFGGFALRTDINAALQAVKMAAAAGMAGGVAPVGGWVGPEDEAGELQDALPKQYATGLWKLELASLTWQLLDQVRNDGAEPPQLYWPTVFTLPLSYVELCVVFCVPPRPISRKPHVCIHTLTLIPLTHSAHSTHSTHSLHSLTHSLIHPFPSFPPFPSLHPFPSIFNAPCSDEAHSVMVYGGAEHDRHSQPTGELWQLELRQCPAGFAGEHCDTKVACDTLNECSGHGLCVGAQLCRCQPGFAAPTCEDFHCHFVANCSAHGACVGPNRCTCTEGYFGDDCALAVMPQRTPQPHSTATRPADAAKQPQATVSHALHGPTTPSSRIAALVFAAVLLLAIVCVCACGKLVDKWYGTSGLQPTTATYTKSAYD